MRVKESFTKFEKECEHHKRILGEKRCRCSHEEGGGTCNKGNCPYFKRNPKQLE